MKKQSAIAVTIGMAISLANVSFAESSQPQPMFEGQHSTQALPAVATSSYLGSLGVLKTAQISYPNVYVWPAFPEKWFSTVRVCNTLGNLFAGANALPLRLEVFDGGGGVVKTVPDIVLQPNNCLSFTSDIPGDLLFSGLAPGVYSVTATVTADDPDALLAILNAGGNLNGAVNSTARDFFKSKS